VASPDPIGTVAKLVGIEVGVVSELSELESSGAERPEGRPRQDECYHEVPSRAQRDGEAAVDLFDDWFDPFETSERVRGFIEQVIEAELDAALIIFGDVSRLELRPHS